MLFSEDSKINTCLEHDYLSRAINKIFRMFDINNKKEFVIIEEVLLGICN